MHVLNECVVALCMSLMFVVLRGIDCNMVCLCDHCLWFVCAREAWLANVEVRPANVLCVASVVCVSAIAVRLLRIVVAFAVSFCHVLCRTCCARIVCLLLFAEQSCCVLLVRVHLDVARYLDVTVLCVVLFPCICMLCCGGLCTAI